MFKCAAIGVLARVRGHRASPRVGFRAANANTREGADHTAGWITRAGAITINNVISKVGNSRCGSCGVSG